MPFLAFSPFSPSPQSRPSNTTPLPETAFAPTPFSKILDTVGRPRRAHSATAFWAFSFYLLFLMLSPFSLARNAPVYKQKSCYSAHIQAFKSLFICVPLFMCRAPVRFPVLSVSVRVLLSCRAAVHIPPLSHPSSHPCLLLPLG
jgi:hypothetical protein